MRGRRADSVRELLERAEVIEEVEAAPVRRDDEVVEALLQGEPRDRRVRELRLEGFPLPAVVERDVERVLGPREEEALPERVLLQNVRVAHRALRDAGADRRPRLPVVRRLQ